jgi:gamma-glutamyltranspeptidase/glutathione hydrolase
MQSKPLLLAALLIVGGPTMFQDEAEAQDRSQARSMVISRYGIVASESPLASQAGASVLARGGHAVDAAVAANAVMGLVAPGSNGIGGDLFAIVYEADSGKFYGLNASGWAPAALTIETLKQQGHDDMPSRGPHSVTVPGTVDGWAKLLQRFVPGNRVGRGRLGPRREARPPRRERRPDLPHQGPGAGRGRSLSQPGPGVVSPANQRGRS